MKTIFIVVGGLRIQMMHQYRTLLAMALLIAVTVYLTQ